MAADLRDSAGRMLGKAEVTLGEARNDTVLASLAVTLTGSPGLGGGPLKGHVHYARVIVSGDPPDTVEIETGWPFLLQYRDDIIVPARSPLDPDRAEPVRAGFLAEDVMLELETDVPRVGVLRVRPALKSHSDWERPSCYSYDHRVDPVMER